MQKVSIQKSGVKMDDRRFERLEVKVDEIKDDVSELKSDVKVSFNRFSDRMDIFAEHIQGDNKIINHIEPLLEKLPEISRIVEDYKFRDELKKRRMERVKKYSYYIGIVGSITGIILTLQRLGII